MQPLRDPLRERRGLHGAHARPPEQVAHRRLRLRRISAIRTNHYPAIKLLNVEHGMFFAMQEAKCCRREEKFAHFEKAQGGFP